MRKMIALSVTSLVLLALGFSFVAAQCQKPNPSTKACYELPDNAVGSCTSIDSYNECVVGSSGVLLYEYEVQDFPEGAVASPQGVTKTVATDCWRFRGCKWNEDKDHCVPIEYWNTWRQKHQTVVNEDPETPCPGE